jgi:hypothetical protein
MDDIDFHNSSTWDNTQLGIASREAINECVEFISESMSGLPWEGKIIKASGTTIYMKPGSKGGVQPGMVFSIYRAGEELIDPDTGLSLGSEESKIGVKSGTGFQAGDLVRIK